MPKVLITTVPFGERSRAPITLLEEAKVEFVINPIGHRLTEDELTDLIGDVDILIAGTEPITERVLVAAPRLRLISRVGIGLDNVDLLAARTRGIAVAYTPDAPSPAVAEMTVGLMLTLVRGIHQANARAHRGSWHRIMGRRLAELTVGIIGVGRIGRRVAALVAPFGGRILANDLDPDPSISVVEWVDKTTIVRHADLVTLHVPLTIHTLALIGSAEIEQMKQDAYVVNTSRGGVVDESALAAALRAGRLAGAAIDVFRIEPYAGELCGLENCVLTCHMASMSEDCRFRMEHEAVTNALSFLNGHTLKWLVPESEYALRAALQQAGR